MATFEIEGRTYEGPEPTGESGLELYSMAIAALEQLGCAGLFVEPDQNELRRMFVATPRLLVSRARAVVLHTLKGWTVDGSPITSDSFAALFGKQNRWHEAGTVTMRIWTDAGFFHVPGTESPAPEPEATPTSG